MTLDSRDDDSYSSWGEFTSHIKAVEANIKSLDDTDICLLYLHSPDSFTFRDKFRQWVKKYEAEVGTRPEFRLVFVAEDLGANDKAKKGRLRFFKGMLEDSFYRKYVKSITVKGNRSVVDLEPNVFSSNVRFEEI